MTLVERVRRLVTSNAFVYLLGSMASRVGGIILIPLYTRRLSPADYGEYSLAVSLLALLPMCASLGLTAGIARVYFDTEDKEAGLKAVGSVARGLVLVVTATLGVLALLVALFAPPILFGLTRSHLLLTIMTSAGLSFMAVPELLFRASQRPKHAVALQLTNFFLTAGFGIAFVLGLRAGLDGALWALAAAALVLGLFGLGYILRLPSADVRGDTRRALHVALPLVPHFVASWLQVTADRWVLTAFGAAASLGAYYLALQILSPIPMLSAAWNDAESPRLGEIYRGGGAAGAYRSMRRMCRNYFLVALAPALALLLGSPLLPLLVGPKFLGALAVLPPLAISFIVDVFYYPAANYLFYIGRTRLLPVVTVTAGLVGVALAILLLPRFGLAGLLASRIVASVTRSSVALGMVYLSRPRHG